MSFFKDVFGAFRELPSAAGDKVLGDWKVGDVVLDDYEVKGIHDGGGMGNVFLVQSRTTNMRFAAKRSKKLSEAARRDFLRELQTWINLPEHPNIVPCRFFRTVNDEVVIFSEYVEGGSLQEWIDAGKLYEGRPEEALKRVLDIAIQMAWGLHHAHEQGVVHQDVKPANVMMTPDGTAKVGDFGLAKARTRMGESASADPKRSVLVSSGWMTPQYCSPEQAKGQPLSRKTDIWSWGVSVLEMFTGEVTWQSGHLAAAVLDQYFAEGATNASIPKIPAEVGEVLRICFREQPTQRWENFGIVVEQLKQVYRIKVGADYKCELATIGHRTATLPASVDHFGREGAEWIDPRAWLELALIKDGRSQAIAAELVAQHWGSRRGQLVAALSTYDEALRIYERLVKKGQKELENELALLCCNAALVHKTADDTSGAVRLCDRAIEIWERLVRKGGPRELANQLAGAYANKAVTIAGLGNLREAVESYDKAIRILESRPEHGDELARASLNKANALVALGDQRAAVQLFNKAIAIWERMVTAEGRSEVASELAHGYMGKAGAIQISGDHQTATALYDQAIAILERMTNHDGRHELADVLAKAYLNKAGVLGLMGDDYSAIGFCDNAIAIWDRLVNQELRGELANDLARAYLNKGNAMTKIGDNLAAVQLYDRAIAIRERLVKQEGRHELVGDLARVKAVRGVTLIWLGETEQGKREAHEAMAILRVEISRTGRADLETVLGAITKELAELRDVRRIERDEGREYASRSCHVCGGLIEATDNEEEWLNCPHCREKLERLSSDHSVAVALEREAARRGKQTTLFCTKWLMAMSEVRRAVPHVQAHPNYRNCLWHAGEFCARPVGFTYHFENDALTKILINFQGLEGSVKDFERSQAQLSRDFCSMSAPCATEEWTLFSRGEANGFIVEHAASNWVDDGMIEKIIFYPPALGSGVKKNP